VAGGRPVGDVVARVVPDVSGLDKQFDYRVPAALVDRASIGALVRVPLHGRRVGGWIIELNDHSDVPIERLVPLAKVSSVGPPADVVDLAMWAATRWGSPRAAGVLRTASPHGNVTALGAPSYGRCAEGGTRPDARVVRLAPNHDPLPAVIDSIGSVPAIVLHPSVAACRALARRLQRQGYSVALLPEQWPAAASGVDVVVGGRSAVFAPCPRVGAIVLIDEHDEAYQEERSPTWHARDVAIERARRCGAAVTLISPAPTLNAVHSLGSAYHATLAQEREGWPQVEVIDRSHDEPWRRSLLSSALIAELRQPERRVLCVMNRLGRARLLACRSCRSVQRCERCLAAVRQQADGTFECQRCDTVRPQVCQQCGSTAMANVKPGVSRLREELEAAANRPVVEVTAASAALINAAVVVGTEAALHRVGPMDVVCFLDFDSELLAPRFRAAEQAMTLLVRGARVAGPRAQGGRVLVQTTLPDHPVVLAALLAEPDRAAAADEAVRRQLRLPPFGALAVVTGEGAGALARSTGLAWSGSDDEVTVTADDWWQLGSALAAAPRPPGSRVRVEVDPPRR
jgi:primosomal protein N' (replication factor Y)